jgi:hypothetical protein
MQQCPAGADGGKLRSQAESLGPEPKTNPATGATKSCADKLAAALAGANEASENTS